MLLFNDLMALMHATCLIVLGLMLGETTEAKRCKARYGEYCPNATAKQCEDCPECPGGFALSTAATLPKSRCGDLECYPCVPCQEGFYRLPHSPFSTCSKFVINCVSLNRLTKIYCGHNMTGVCGDCQKGPGILNITSEACAKDVLSVGARSLHTFREDSPKVEKETLTWQTVFSVGFGVGGVITIVVLFVHHLKKYKCFRNTKLTRVPISQTRLDVTMNDLDTDFCAENHVRGELQSSDEPRDLDQLVNPVQTWTQSSILTLTIPKEFNNIIIGVNHGVLDQIAYHLYDSEKVCKFFDCLKIAKARYINKIEHWFNNEIDKFASYEVIMLDILKHWCQKETNNATLYVLLQSLNEAGFINLARDLTRTYSAKLFHEFEEQETNNIVSADMGESNLEYSTYIEMQLLKMPIEQDETISHDKDF